MVSSNCQIGGVVDSDLLVQAICLFPYIDLGAVMVIHADVKVENLFIPHTKKGQAVITTTWPLHATLLRRLGLNPWHDHTAQLTLHFSSFAKEF